VIVVNGWDEALPRPTQDGSLIGVRRMSYVLYREEEFIVAQCLEVDVSSFGADHKEAVANLKEAVELYFEGESGDAYTPVSEVVVGQEMVNA